MKNLSKLLAILMACVLLVSCAPALAEVPEGYPEILIDPNTGKPYDLGGEEVYLISWDGSPTGERKEAETAFEQDTYDYQDWLMETYNFTYKKIATHVYEDNAKALLDFASAETAPMTAAFNMYTPNVLAPFRSGLLRPMDYDFLNLEDASRYNKDIVELFTKDGKHYGIADLPGVNNVLIFNKELLADCGIDASYIYELVENEEWNFENFENILAQCTKDFDNDGIIDLYGYVGNQQPEFNHSIANNGGALFSIRDGKFVITASEDATLDALNWFTNVWFNYCYLAPEGANWDYYYEAFDSGKAVFYFGAVWEFANEPARIDLDFDYGLVPWPMGMGVNAQYSQISSPHTIVLPGNLTDDQAWKVMFVLDQLRTPTPGYGEDDEVWKTQMYNNVCDEESVELTGVILRENSVFNVTNCIGAGNDLHGSGFYWNMTGSEGQYTWAELIEGKMPMWTAAVAKANGEEIVEVVAE